MDIQRFKTVNTAKGPWPLLELLSTAEVRDDEPSASQMEPELVKAQISMADIQRAVREVAARIIGETLEGKAPQLTSCSVLSSLQYIALLCSSCRA